MFDSAHIRAAESSEPSPPSTSTISVPGNLSLTCPSCFCQRFPPDGAPLCLQACGQGFRQFTGASRNAPDREFRGSSPPDARLCSLWTLPHAESQLVTYSIVPMRRRRCQRPSGFLLVTIEPSTTGNAPSGIGDGSPRASAASISPIRMPNLKPWPEKPVPMMTPLPPDARRG